MNSEIATGAERRTHGRHAIHTEVILDLADSRRLVGRTLDVGKGGMGIVADINPPYGSTFKVRVLLPTRPRGAGIFEAEVRAVNSIYTSRDGGFRIGVQFVKVSPEAEDVLNRFLP